MLTYEMIVGFPPFYTGNNNNAKMYQLIKSKPVYYPDPQRHNIHMSDECKDFITKVSERFSSNPSAVARQRPQGTPWQQIRRVRNQVSPLVCRHRLRETCQMQDRPSLQAQCLRRSPRRIPLRLDVHFRGGHRLSGLRLRTEKDRKALGRL